MTNDHFAALAAERTTMTEPEAKRVLVDYGISVPDFDVVDSADGAARAADQIGTPVVVKVASGAVVHKSEWADGLGVQTGLDSPEEAATATQSILEAAAQRDIDAAVLVEASVDLSQGTEIIIGGSRDPSFGPTVLVGHGGVFTELYEDTAHRLAPLSPSAARDAVDELQVAPLLDGYRNRSPADTAALVDAIVAIGDLMQDNSEIADVDVNPIHVSPDGAIALDAHIALEE